MQKRSGHSPADAVTAALVSTPVRVPEQTARSWPLWLLVTSRRACCLQKGGCLVPPGPQQVTHGSFMDPSFPGVNVAQCHASTHGLALEAGSLLNRDPQTTPGSKARTQHSCGPGSLGF